MCYYVAAQSSFKTLTVAMDVPSVDKVILIISFDYLGVHLAKVYWLLSLNDLN